ncbi:glutathione-disulfide reductase [Ferruginivarius sediminum]|uniref:Glutathione reductase n=1 Tax=Ferruginivarius sediminum TaxID=2661937 RepID=A0A369T8D8_9PROT|nr:glutathione-disulfide reductase [Ferruginivarius sediminum]RDD61591.1 glutathione-disulfide reductase [Ferruginivarius sediminum]
MAYDYDLFVIGAGSGGVRGARMASAAGARVALAESDRFGGTCVIRGCVPKKLLSYAAHVHEEVEDAAGYGWSIAEPVFDWPTLIANKDREIDRLEGIYQKLLADAGVSVYLGRARMIDAHTVAIDDEQGNQVSVTAETVLIAVGGHAVVPDIPGHEHGITSREAFHLKSLPRRVVVVGGGYIAVEFAGIFNGLGAEVTQLYRRDKILRGFDEDVRDTLTEEIRKKGVALRVNADPAGIERRDDGTLVVVLKDGSTIETDAVMFATGRRPNTTGLGLDRAGVEMTHDGAIKVDDYSKTTADNIYAVGDVTNRIQLTPVAIAEAMAFVDTVYHGRPRAMDHANVPSAVFSQPPIGSVGLSEAEAARRGHRLEIFRAAFRPMKHTLSGRDEKTMMKLVVDAETRLVLGVHMVGMDAPEIVQGMAVAVKAGATKEIFDATVGIHPTAAEEFVTMRAPTRTVEKQAAE